jgi:hypothetical protein
VIVSVTPSTVALNGTATVTVLARNADGTPVARGEAVTLTTTLGALTPAHPTIQANGTATATLDAEDREGTATITAIVGSSEPATTTVDIVLDAATAISVTANPSSIPAGSTSKIEVTATVTDNRAKPVEGALVTFESEIGKFDSNTSETTDSKGQATKTLTVSPAGITASTETFTITVKTPSSTGNSFLEGSTTVRISRPSGGT